MKRSGPLSGAAKVCPKCGKRGLVVDGRAGSGKIRWTCQTGSTSVGTRVKCYSTTDPNAAFKGKGEPEKKIVFEGLGGMPNGVYVISWAQNATPIHKGFWASLMTFKRARKATLMIQPGRYKNPTSRWEESQRNAQWWDPAVVPYLVNIRRVLNKNLVLLADIHTQPTAVTPLTGFESITHGESGILPHPKLQMSVIPTPHQRMPKILTTTGAVTKANYSDTKAGAKGGFHHVFGAVVVEIDGPLFHLRHINARGDGVFCDLDKAYYPDGRVKDAGAYHAVVFGDTHVRFTDKAVDRATFGPGGLVERLNPKALVFHDLLDGYAVNPHHMFKPFIAVSKFKAAYADIEDEVLEAGNWLLERARRRQAYVVSSNHNDFLARWMSSNDWRNDPENAEFYLETALHMVRGSKMSESGAETPDPFHYWLGKLNADNIRCVGRHESLMLAGVECSLHGDQGPSGTRGSRAALAKIGAKTFIGHSHTPGITDGCYQVGTSTPLRLEYSGAVGSWLACHGSLDPMGKRHLHVCVAGAFWKGQK